MTYGWPPLRFGVKPHASTAPRLATARGVTLGSTLAAARTAYGRLDLIGTDRWRTRDGLVLYDDPRRGPARIIEIKAGTCGDF
jgi:hypothetical protein